MTYSEPKELIRAKQLTNEGEFDEALQLMKNFEEMGSQSLQDKVLWHLLKCDILVQQDRFNDIIYLAERTFKESLGLGKTLLSVDALQYIAAALIELNDLERAEIMIKKTEETLKSISNVPLRDFKQREAQSEIIKARLITINPNRNESGNLDLLISHLQRALEIEEKYGEKYKIASLLLSKGHFELFFKGRADHAQKYLERALIIAKESNRKFTIARCLYGMGLYYHVKGELDHGLKAYEQSVKLWKELKSKLNIARNYNCIADLYRMKGNTELAIQYSKQSVLLSESDLREQSNNLDFLIVNLIENGDLESAKEYLKKLEQISSKLQSKAVSLNILSHKALLLKMSTRVRNRGKAEEIFKDILSRDPTPEIKKRALLNLSDLLLIELRTTSDLEVLNELNQNLTRLIDIAEKSKSYLLLAEIYFLKAKLASTTLNLKDARRFLTQAKQISKRWGFNKLAASISTEREKLGKQLIIWENLKNEDISLGERIKIAGLDVQMEHLLRQSPILTAQVKKEKITIHKEQRICLICRGEVSGYTYTCSCNSIYCENCARALTDLENACWVCNVPLDVTKPSKPYKEEKAEKKMK